MGGKAALLLVLGFSLIFMVAGINFNNMATSTVDNVSNYYLDAKTHHIAAAGVNLVINRLFLDATIPDQVFNFNFDGGTISATLTTTDIYQNLKTLLVVGSYGGTTSTIRINLKPSLFSKYAYYSSDEGGNIWWTSADTVWGPFHTNDDLRIAYHPVFMGKVTIGGNEIKYNSSSSAQYMGGFQNGIQIDLPSNGISNVADAATGGAKFTGKNQIYFEFRGDSCRYKFNSKGSYTYELLSTFAPNGVIYAQNSELRIKGTVKGSYTIAASGNEQDRGNIFIDDNIVYNSDARTNPSSQDMLGIIAERNVIITENSANNSNVTIQASIYCQEGSFTAEDYSSRPVSGFIDLYGGITQNIRGPVGTFSGTTINHGFSKRYRYDNRLLISYPPYYPGCGSYEIVSWFE